MSTKATMGWRAATVVASLGLTILASGCAGSADDATGDDADMTDEALAASLTGGAWQSSAAAYRTGDLWHVELGPDGAYEMRTVIRACSAASPCTAAAVAGDPHSLAETYGSFVRHAAAKTITFTPDNGETVGAAAGAYTLHYKLSGGALQLTGAHVRNADKTFAKHAKPAIDAAFVAAVQQAVELQPLTSAVKVNAMPMAAQRQAFWLTRWKDYDQGTLRGATFTVQNKVVYSVYVSLAQFSGSTNYYYDAEGHYLASGYRGSDGEIHWNS